MRLSTSSLSSTGTMSALAPAAGISVTASMPPVIRNGFLPAPRRADLTTSAGPGVAHIIGEEVLQFVRGLLHAIGVPVGTAPNGAGVSRLHPRQQLDGLIVLELLQGDLARQGGAPRADSARCAARSRWRAPRRRHDRTEAGRGASVPLLHEGGPLGFRRKRRASHGREQRPEDGADGPHAGVIARGGTDAKGFCVQAC